jgi:hypothetical protein
MSDTTLFSGPKKQHGMTRRHRPHPATESPSCGEQIVITPSTSFLSCLWSRYLTKMCDQVVALLSPKQSASLVWNDQESDTESVDMDIGDSDRLYTFEVAKTNEQEQSAVARPGFKVLFSLLTVVPCLLTIADQNQVRYYLGLWGSSQSSGGSLWPDSTPCIWGNFPGCIECHLYSSSD